MAKQRGIHQISGKINDLCYYQQKYVPGGLIRRINEAMSGRLKTDPVFERTRVANRLFGAASLLAKSFLVMFDVYGDLLTYPSRQAKLTRGFLSFIRSYVSINESADIDINSLNHQEFLNLTDIVMKNKLSLFFPSIVRYTSELGLEERFNITLDESSLFRYLKYCKATALFVRIAGPYDVDVMSPNDENGKYTQPIVGGRESVINTIWEDGGGDLSITLDVGVPLNYRTYYTISIIPMLGNDYRYSPRLFSRACAGFFIAQVTY